jgi:3-methyl-2-oxobutanoate hydroxymethyltransferase
VYVSLLTSSTRHWVDVMNARRLSVPQIRAMKRRRGDAALTMVTAYDEPTARIVDAAGVDMILVGDSVGNVVLGRPDTLSVTIEEMVHHTAAVAAAQPSALVVADMPWMSYHVSIEESVRNAASLIRAGADAIKLEGGMQRLSVIEAIIHAEIPVMGHLGLTPQSVRAFGGFKVQGKSVEAAHHLLSSAKAIEAAGCFAMVIEGVPDVLGTEITKASTVPTIGIGAGADTDGQVLVFHDLLGLSGAKPPKFVRQYVDLADIATQALKAYVADVHQGAFPDVTETYTASEELTTHLQA